MLDKGNISLLQFAASYSIQCMTSTTGRLLVALPCKPDHDLSSGASKLSCSGWSVASLQHTMQTTAGSCNLSLEHQPGLQQSQQQSAYFPSLSMAESASTRPSVCMAGLLLQTV